MTLLGSLLKWFALLLGAALAAFTLLGLLHNPAAGPLGSSDRFVQIDGLAIRYRQAGAGPDILLAHGSPGSIEDWEAVWESLAQRYRVTAYDRPGHGYSGGLGSSLAGNAATLRALIAALNLRTPVLVGHSYGGATALRVAIDDPPEVSAYVLVGARGYGPINVEPIYRLIAVPWLGTGFARVCSGLLAPRLIRRGIMASFAPNQALLPAGFIEPRIALWSQTKVAVAAARERVGFESSLEDMAAGYHGIRKPVFVVVGDGDAAPLASATRLSRDIPGARLLVLPETGHYIQYARPAELLHVIETAVSGDAIQARAVAQRQRE